MIKLSEHAYTEHHAGPAEPDGWYLYDSRGRWNTGGPFKDERAARRYWLLQQSLEWNLFAPDALSVALKAECIRVHPTARIDSFVKLEGGQGISIGPYVHVASFCHIGIGGGTIILEEGSACASGSRLLSGSNVPGLGHGCSAAAPDAVFKRSFVHLCRNAVVFTGATVLPGITIGENSVVAAGALITRDVPPFEIWSGVPAQKIGEIK